MHVCKLRRAKLLKNPASQILNKEPKLLAVPIGLFDAIINTLQYIADVLKMNPLLKVSD